MLGIARDARYRNFRMAAVPFTPRIPAPLAQTVRHASMRTILDLLETWVNYDSGLYRKADKNADVSALQVTRESGPSTVKYFIG